MKEAYLLLRSSAVLEEEQAAPASAALIRLDRVAGPYAAILRARGSASEIEELAALVGIGASDVCWLAKAVSGGDAFT